ncbi:DUF3575 domain-containing protein [Parabacteroides sp.]
MRNYKQGIVLLALLVSGVKAIGQEDTTEVRKVPTFGIKTNLLYDMTASLNLGAEFRTGDRTSLDLSAGWNPFTFSDNRKWKHILIQPEFRLWAKETFSGHFFGLHAHYAYYNVGQLPHGPFSKYMADHRFEGWLTGAGVSYGYRWNFSRNWGMEATIGVGYAHLDYTKYKCETCGEKLGNETKNYFGPTKVGITLIYSFGGKKKAAVPPPVQVIVQEPEQEEPVVIYEPQFKASYLVPEVEAVKQRSEAGHAYLDFAVGRSEIVSDFRNNVSELKKIYDLVETVKNDPDATITGITITGYASPEGSYDFNLMLSERRAFALKKQIKAIYGFSENWFNVSGRGEDWAMLDTLVTHSDMVNKYAVLEIIRSMDDFDRRESRLKALAGGIPYLSMKTDLFPRLRRSDYELHYTVLPFTVEKGKEVFHTHPSNLSLNEMFLIANTYEPGSDAFNEVFETAARIFPSDDVANLNAAASALGRKDTISAARYLEKVTNRSAEYWNNAGILAFLEGDKLRAEECFAKAREKNDGKAFRNAVELNKHNQSQDNITPIIN